MEDVSPAIRANVERHETCTVEALLNAFLSHCLLEEHKHNPPDLLKQCLKAVLPLCNTRGYSIDAKQEQSKDKIEELEDHLELRKNLGE